MINQDAPSVLAKIGQETLKRIKSEKQRVSIKELERIIATNDFMPKDFKRPFSEEGLHVIAEVKLASPSRGIINDRLSPTHIAQSYLENGATAISVLTEPRYFRGDINHLKSIRTQNQSAYLLMKDFFLDHYQLYTARAAGADAILVIVALLGRQASMALYKEALNLQLTPLVEVHDIRELEIALDMGAKLIGINNRNLKSLAISLTTTEDLMKQLPKDVIAISESGFKTSADLVRMRKLGCHGFLIGTSLMATDDPGAALAKLLRGNI